MSNYQCSYCGFQYDEWYGDSKNGVPTKVPFQQLAGTLCSRCGIQGERHVRQQGPKYEGIEAEYYDMFCGKAGHAFYLQWLKETKAEHVLELGTGTGQLALELLKHGLSITGVDWSPEMLTVAKKKLARMKEVNSEQISFIEEDVLALQVNKTFSHLIIPHGLFQHFVTVEEQKALLDVVRRHLHPNGMVAIDLVLPPSEKRWRKRQRKQLVQQNPVYLTIESELALAQQLVHYSITYEVYKKHVLEAQYRVEREMSVIHPRELTYLLTLEGFEVLDVRMNYQPMKDRKSHHLPESMAVPLERTKAFSFSKTETLEQMSEAIEAGLLEAYREHAWEAGGYPFFRNVPDEEITTYTIIAKGKA